MKCPSSMKGSTSSPSSSMPLSTSMPVMSREVAQWTPSLRMRSPMMMTGTWKRSARLNASYVRWKHSRMSPGVSTARGNSPWDALMANSRSACSVRVARPVAGPGRWPSITTRGISASPARPRASVMRQKPPPEVPVIARAPAELAPMAIMMADISSSVCLATMPISSSIVTNQWSRGDAGVMG